MITRLILALAPLALANAQDFHEGYWKRTSSGGGPDTFVIPLVQDLSGFYHSSVRMGSDDQKFNFSISGSTGYTIVAGQVCNACGDQNPLYTGSNSSTFQSLNTVLDVAVDGVNQVFGNLAKENCGLKQNNGNWWQYNNQTVLIANSVNDGSREVFNRNISGILGLSPTIESRSAMDTVLGAWLSKHPQAQNVSVGFALSRPEILNATTNANISARSTTNSSPAGEMHMIAPDPDSYYGQLNYVPTASYESSGGSTSGTGGGQQMQAAGWSTKLEEWTFLNGNGDRVVGGQGAIAAVDPWYTVIIMPKSQSESIFAKIPGSQMISAPDASQQAWNIPCNTHMNLTISIGGIDFDIDSRDVVLQGDSAGGNGQKRQDAMCECGVQGWTDPGVSGYMLGSPFMRNSYVVYNNAQANSTQENSIGFARRFPFTPPNPSQSQQARTTGIIIGSVTGVLVLLGLAALGWLWVRTKSRNTHRAPSDEFMDKPSAFVHGGFTAGGGRNTGVRIGGLSITPSIIFTTYTGGERRGSDPEAYPLMQTPPTTASPPREGRPVKSFANQQQQPPVAPYNDEPPRELHDAAHEAYLARIARRTQVRWSSTTGGNAGYAKIEDQDRDVGAHAYGDHAPVYEEQGRHNPDRSPPRSANAWDQPYYPPAPSVGSRVSMVVEPIAKPAEVALPKDETKN